MSRIMRFKTLLFFFVLGLSVISNAAKKERIITGTVSDSKSGEVLIGATIFNIKSGKGISSNAQGHYVIWVSNQCDSVVLEVSYMGYIKQIKTPTCTETNIDWKLEPASFNLTGVEVTSNSRKALDPKLSSFTISKSELNALPGFAGEKDLLKYLQLTPGVQITGDGNSNLYVRGGSSDQNLFLLDDMPLYHVSHVGNLTSTFNADIIKNAEIYLGSFPAEYGGRLSSVVDVRTIDGDLNKHHQSLTLGMLTSKLLFDGPLIIGKASYVLSFRMNTIPFFKWLFDMNVDFSMYDTNLKVNYILSPNSRLYLSFYKGNDAMIYNVDGTDNTFKADISTSWGNTATSLRYNYIFSPQLYLNLIAGYTKYQYAEKSNLEFFNVDRVLEDKFKNNFISNIADNFVVLKSNYSFNNNIKAQIGYNFIYHTYQPGHSIIQQSGLNLSTVNIDLGYPTSNAFDHNLFADITINNLYGFGLNAGIRENIIQTGKTTFHDLQPRLILSRKITNEFAAKIAYCRIWQPFHLLSNNGAGIPADYRIPAMDIAPPATCNQSSLALNYIPEYSDYEFSAELYYKEMHNLTDIKEGVTYTADYSNWVNILATKGNGIAKGIELLLRKVKGTSTGWIGATLANSTRQFNDLNGGKVFPDKYDRLFHIGCFFQQQVTKNLTFSATWVFGTGLPYNIPKSQYEDINGNYVLIYGDLNEYRQKTYHRLDVGLSYKVQNRKSTSIWDFSVINVYNRRNPYLYQTTSMSDWGVKLYEFSLFPILPSLSYSVRF